MSNKTELAATLQSVAQKAVFPMTYVGKVVTASEQIAIQNIGRDRHVEHIQSDLERQIYRGENLEIKYPVTGKASVEPIGAPDRACPEYDITLELWNRKASRSKDMGR